MYVRHTYIHHYPQISTTLACMHAYIHTYIHTCIFICVHLLFKNRIYVIHIYTEHRMRSNLDLFSFDLTSDDMLKLNSCSLNHSPPIDDKVSLIVKNRSGRPLQWYWSRKGSTEGFVVPSDDWVLTEEISPYDTSYQISWKGVVVCSLPYCVCICVFYVRRVYCMYT